MTAAKIPNIYQRISAVQREVAYVQKDKDVKVKTRSGGEFSYKATTHDAVVSSVRSAMVDQGIVLRLSTQEISREGNRVGLKLQFDFVNVDDPADFMPVTVFAHADDMSDKAPGKSYSMAKKYALLQTFLLETGEEEESRSEVRAAKAEPLTAKQLEVLVKLVEPHEDISSRVLAAYRVETLSEIHANDYQQLLQMIKGAIGAKKKRAAKDGGR